MIASGPPRPPSLLSATASTRRRFPRPAGPMSNSAAGRRDSSKVLDERVIAYADFRGNRQYLSSGNLAGDDRISLILIDYANRRRLKIWGRANLVDIAADPVLVGRLHYPSYRRPERAVVITIEAFDWNCPPHIPQRLTLKELEPHLAPLRDQIAGLTAGEPVAQSRVRSTDFRTLSGRRRRTGSRTPRVVLSSTPTVRRPADRRR